MQYTLLLYAILLSGLPAQRRDEGLVWASYCTRESSWAECFGSFVLANPADHHEAYYLKRGGGLFSEEDRERSKTRLLTTI